MTTINLQKGLEAYYTFDNVDVDGQRNIVRDRSGNGRHLELSGGVTTGVESPVGEAASFDGNDDQGEAKSFNENVDTEFTLFGIAKVDTSDSNPLAIYSDQLQGEGVNLMISADGNIEVRFDDDTNTTHRLSYSLANPERYVTVGLRWKQSEIWDLWVDGERVKGDTPPTNGYSQIGDYAEVALNTWINSSPGAGEISLVMAYSRSASGAEMKSLDRMTARRVSHL